MYSLSLFQIPFAFPQMSDQVHTHTHTTPNKSKPFGHPKHSKPQEIHNCAASPFPQT